MSERKTAPGRPSKSFDPIRQRRPVPLWPEPDQQAWERARRPGGPFEAPGRAAAWAPTTCRARSGSWGQFLSWLDSVDQLDPAEAPADRLTFERLGGHIKSLRARTSAHTTYQSIVELQAVIK